MYIYFGLLGHPQELHETCFRIQIFYYMSINYIFILDILEVSLINLDSNRPPLVDDSIQ